MSAGICPEISIFQGGEMVFVASVYRKRHERKKRQLCVKDVFIYQTVSWAPIPYKNLRYRLDTNDIPFKSI